jgi:hypothetical protein
MNIKLFLPPVIVLSVTIIISLIDIEFQFFPSVNIIWFVLFRMVRISAILMISVYLLKPVSSFIGSFINRNHRIFFYLHEPRGPYKKDLFQLWILRPLQGIGISMFLTSKLIYLLHIYYNIDKSFQLITPVAFSWQKFAQTAMIIVPISIILSVIWMLSDLSIRYFNKKSSEVIIFGNAMGLILPMLFGFHGVLELIEDNPGFMAFFYVIQITLALYPPFAFYTVYHYLYTSKNRANLLNRLGSRKAAIDVDWK